MAASLSSSHDIETFYDVFISYDFKLKDKVLRLYNNLSELGFKVNCILNLNDSKETSSSSLKHIEAILESKIFICCLKLSYTSVTPLILISFTRSNNLFNIFCVNTTSPSFDNS